MKAQPPHDRNADTGDRSSPVQRFRRPEAPDWHWLEQRDDPAVKAFLEAANEQADRWFSPLAGLTERLYHGHLARRELAERSLAVPLDHFTIWNETAANADHPVWWRHPNDAPQNAEPFLDLQARASHSAFFEIGDMALSPDETWLAWTEDTQATRPSPSGCDTCRGRTGATPRRHWPRTLLGGRRQDIAVHALRRHTAPGEHLAIAATTHHSVAKCRSRDADAARDRPGILARAGQDTLPGVAGTGVRLQGHQ